MSSRRKPFRMYDHQTGFGRPLWRPHFLFVDGVGVIASQTLSHVGVKKTQHTRNNLLQCPPEYPPDFGALPPATKIGTFFVRAAPPLWKNKQIENSCSEQLTIKLPLKAGRGSGGRSPPAETVMSINDINESRISKTYLAAWKGGFKLNESRNCGQYPIPCTLDRAP